MGTYSRTDDLIASYSSKGPSTIDLVVKPDIVAPGNQVVSLLAPGSTLGSEAANSVSMSYYKSPGGTAASPSFLMLNGTSMATPVVSGAVADMLQGQPSLTPDQVKARLMKTAYKTFPASSTAVDPVTGQTFASQYDILTIGAGYLDIAAVLANHDLATGTAMSPTAYYDPNSGNVYLVYDPSSQWDDTDVYAALAIGGTPGMWGTQTVWGPVVVSANRAVWGSRAVWAAARFQDSAQSGDRAVFGEAEQSGVVQIPRRTGLFGVPMPRRRIPTSISPSLRRRIEPASKNTHPIATKTLAAGWVFIEHYAGKIQRKTASKRSAQAASLWPAPLNSQ